MKTCPQCHTKFAPARKEQVWCSKSCASVRKGELRRGQKTGPQKWRIYKRRKDRDGYVRVYAALHPFRGPRLMILEHVMVMEQRIGRRILPTECVHHRDGNRRNNALKNLELMLRSRHSRLHGPATAKKRKRGVHGRFA